METAVIYSMNERTEMAVKKQNQNTGKTPNKAKPQMQILPLAQQHPLSDIVAPLMDWYEKNARVLPWRENTDAYRVWVSEIMLQQTRVETVIDYYNRFLAQLPDVQALAAAPEEMLLKLWEGLGYYSRVKNMQKAAKVICEEHQGVFPHEFADILALPGIGAYTAGAISSIAFEQPTAAVDGNVLRVITRLTADSHDIADTAFRSAVSTALAAVYPVGKCGVFTQSLMELGAVVCVPNGAPHCGECPIAQYCEAKRRSCQTDFPVKKEKAARKVQKMTVFLLHCDGAVAVRKRAAGGLLGGLWEFPNAAGHLTLPQMMDWLSAQGLAVENSAELVRLPSKKHIFTHIEWHMDCWQIMCRRQKSEDAFVWVSPKQLDEEIALPTAFRKVWQP